MIDLSHLASELPGPPGRCDPPVVRKPRPPGRVKSLRARVLALLHVAAEFGRYNIAKCEHLPSAVQPTCARSQRFALHRSRLTD